MTDNMEKKCSKCRQLKLMEEFDEGKARCKNCSEYKQQYRENHREELRLKAKEMYEQNKKQIQNKHKERVEHPICKIEVGRNTMKRHERSKRHQDIMTNTKETKQEREPKNIEKEKEQVRRQQVIDDINHTFPSYQELGT